MYLKSLTLKGFKSFADKTTLVFDPGLTVVVGPNGSGKSNISDAILWVLGEQSPKALRGQAMEDVIFSGSSARKAVSMAEVTLVLDNSDETLPVDYSEVAITRRMYRSGESEYLINGSPSRLMDITDILHDSGLGKETHSIISQGHLDSVLAGRPEDRRELIEEAAGIAKHRRRKERSERKLKRMDENLTRAKDVNREIHRQLRPLERQVSKARRAHEVETELKSLRLTLAVDDLRALKERHEGLGASLRQAEAARELAKAKLDQRSQELERYQSLLEEKGLYVGDLDAQRRRSRDQIARLEADSRLLEQKARAMDARIADLRASAERADRDRREAEEDHARVVRDLEQANAETEALRGKVGELTPKAQEATRRRRELGGKVAQLTADQRSAQRTADQETVAYAKLRDQVDNAAVEDQMFESRLKQLDESLSSCEERLGERRAHRDEVSASLDEAQRSSEAAREEIGAAQGRLRDLRQKESSARDALSRQRATLSALRSVDHQTEDASPLAAALAKRAQAAGSLQCRLGDVIQAPEELEGLVERLLGDDLGALVVGSSSDVVGLAREASSAKRTTGRVTVVSRDLAGRPQAAPAVPGLALTSRLTVRDGFEDLVGAFLGDIHVVDSAQAAVEAHASNPALTYVTREGFVLLPDGRAVMGETSGSQTGVLERKRRIRALEASLPELEGALSAATEATSKADSELTAARERNATAKGDLARLRGELSSVTSEIGRLEGEQRRSTGERAQVEKKRAEAAKRVESARAQIDQHRAAAKEAEERAADLGSQLQEAQDARSEASHEESEADRRLSEAKLRLATVQERRNHLNSRAADLIRRLQALEGTGDQSARDLGELEARRRRVPVLQSLYAAVSERASAWSGRLEDKASLAEADSESLKKTIGEAKAAVAAATDELERARAAASDARVEQGKLEVQVENAVSGIEATGAPLEQALLLPPPDDREADEARIEELAGELKSIGPVNEVAMDQYARLKERADYIGEQVADLEAARKSLSKITAAIDRKMKRQFLVVFDQVNANFADIFKLLFPGGEAHLEMTDPDNPAETGIEVVAQPEGKKIQKMTLMSGGEKSLTALALLFAVYRTRTVPFYVFDEIEAALDDANLSRLLTAIDTLRSTTQLIAISHQRRTMEDADVLYGVSMQADGVSHVVSQRLDHKKGR